MFVKFKEVKNMKDTSEFVQTLKENNKKQEKNKHKGKGHPESSLPNKQH